MGNPKEEELEEQQAPLLPQYSGDEKIYTPPSTASNSSESQPDLHTEAAIEDAREHDRLLTSAPPPGYRDHVRSPGCQRGDLNVDIKDDSPEESASCRQGAGRFRRWWRARRRCHRRENDERRERPCCVKIFVALKAVFIVWLCLWLVRWAAVRFIRRHHRHHHHSVGYHNYGFGCHSKSSREIVVRERESWIFGNYPLYDLLDLRTTTGSVYVTIVPQPAHQDDPTRPAKVSIRSRTGNVFVRFKMPDDAAVISDALATYDLEEPQPSLFKEVFFQDPAMNHHSWQSNSSLPPRPYEIDIQTRSGNVFAVLGFSTHASVTTRSGNISTHLTPLVFENTTFPQNRRCKRCDDVSITTRTRSGNVSLKVTEPSFIAPEKPEHIPEAQDNIPHSKMRIDTRSNSSSRQEKWNRILQALNKKPSHAELKPCSHSELRVNAYHISRNSANMAISYPRSWAGRVIATDFRHGNVVLRGEGLEVVRRSPHGFLATKKPTVGLDDKKSWWGSKGNMSVGLESRGLVEFDIRG
ncbi:hypothetical protein H109_08020 [Trichophyton interdigitale MR816]|uniref:Uncharacterized protein n=1 Tax=Trichophyton interdigitale (strain MR816) TaxID=1215338 RepID=A0A059IWV9_TRIIM|nr:hypothetical protein H101_04251 [Trichophyton interdigitale H6]KDB20024.1 hypothetical protein H109_08020 [Trichophyton interdigitale MR816]